MATKQSIAQEYAKAYADEFPGEPLDGEWVGTGWADVEPQEYFEDYDGFAQAVEEELIKMQTGK